MKRKKFIFHEKYYQKDSEFVDVEFVWLKEPMLIDKKSLPWTLKNNEDTPKVTKENPSLLLNIVSAGKKYEVYSPALTVLWSDQTAIVGRINCGVRRRDWSFSWNIK